MRHQPTCASCPRCGVLFRTDAEFCVRDGTRLERPARDALVGRTLAGRYRVLQGLREGGSGRVYAVEDTKVRRKYAVKVPFGDALLNPLALERFRREAAAAGTLDHPNVASVVDFQLDAPDEPPFLVMELVEGESIQQLVERQGPLSENRVRELLDGILEGLAHAHAHGVLHRDLKPDNIIVARETGLARIVDFGISQSLEARGGRRLTSHGMVVGTMGFIPPEALRGRNLEASSDLYSLAVTVHFMLTGQLPFEDDEDLILSATLEGLDFSQLEEAGVSSGLREDLEGWISLDPRARPRLAQALGGSSSRAPIFTPPPSRLEGLSPRLKSISPKAGLPILLGLIGLIAGVMARPKPPPAETTTTAAVNTETVPEAAVSTAIPTLVVTATPTPSKPRASSRKSPSARRRGRLRKVAKPAPPPPKPSPSPPSEISATALAELYRDVGQSLDRLPTSASTDVLRTRYFRIRLTEALRDPRQRRSLALTLRSMKRDIRAATLSP